jgi:predicted CXXCH cytochrome family protein
MYKYSGLALLVALVSLPAACRNLQWSHGGGEGTGSAPPGNCLGRACHSSILSRPYLHTPAGDGRCGICHERARSDHPRGEGPEFRRVMASSPLVCYDCHYGYEDAPQTAHTPWRMGQCMECHEPHGSEIPALVKKEVNGLCLYCHRDLAARLERTRFGHGADGENCVSSCHAAHWSEQRHLLREKEETLCVSCHGTSEGCLQPGNDNAASTGGTCTGCHFPHGSVLPNMLKINDFIHLNRP